MGKTLEVINAIDKTEVVVEAPPGYDLRRTLTCGQAFRWRWAGDVATGIVGKAMVEARQQGRMVFLQVNPGTALPAVLHYLALDEPLHAIEEELSHDKVLRALLPKTSGIVLLRQDPWECLVSYVLSSWNNIPKITYSLERLARELGSQLAPGFYSLPGPDVLARASHEVLQRCSVGYRASYLQGIARAVAEGEIALHRIGERPFQESRDALLRLPGVGQKVADCVLLFAYGYKEAFPVDVWVKRAVELLYFDGRVLRLREIQEFAKEKFGPLAGYAQQHLFTYARIFLRGPNPLMSPLEEVREGLQPSHRQRG
ncbi:MAG: DNA glycosylase [Armatimonadota bacterium]|nr:DNA glycosylase [Armatimonadota bacterium]